ncbi:hypothetical protein GCM10023189_22670 [Nibrella saemangeumensis]|uniref:histidine kinase n=2 Tax=Nibrella saemangeumensis TaxID=1084526 RepID=A0ABP8MSD7_9BACT
MNVRFFEATPGISVVLRPDAPVFTLVAVSNDFIRESGMKREDVIGKGHFEVFPKSPDDPHFTGEQNLKASFDYIIRHRQSHDIPAQRYDVPMGDGTFSQRYWKIRNAPVLSEAGEVQYIIHSATDITSQIKAEHKAEAARGLEQTYNFFINAPVIIGFVRGDTYVVELANESLLEVWGRTSDVIGKPLLIAIPELEGQGFIELLDQVRKTGEPYYAYEAPITLYRRGKPEVFYFDFVYQPYYESETEEVASGVISVGHDVTEQVLARKKIQESEEKYRSLFESMDQGFCVLEMLFDDENKPLDYRFLEVNPVFEKQTGLQNAVGKTARELVPDLEAHWFELYGNVALTGKSVRFTEGSQAMGRWFDVAAFRIGDHTSRKVALLFTNITEQKQVEEALKQSEEQFRTLANSIFQLAWMADPSGWIHWYNDRWYSYTGTTLDEMKGWGWEKVHHPDHIERVVTFVKEAWRKGEPWELTFPLRGHDGTYRWFLTRSYPVKDEQGRVTQWIGTNTDIDAQKQAEGLLEEKVRERTQALEQKNRELEQFAYVSHHDLKEPIRKIMLFSEMVKAESYAQLSEASQHRLDRVIDAAQRMSTALKDILDFASLTKTEPFSAVDLTEVLVSVRTDLELVIAEKQARLVVTDLPVLRAVPGQMHQLFYNLVSNALKFSKPDLPPTITVESRLIDASEAGRPPGLETGRTYYQITVRDNGIGFTPDNAEKIFVMFQRLHNRKAYSGTGIGLALAKKVVTNHGGTIWAEGQLGEGATFQILLPAS